MRAIFLRALLFTGAAASDSDAPVCQAGGRCEESNRVHHWPNVRGRVGSYGTSEVKAPRDFSKPSWRWHHPDGQYGTVVVGGPVIDDKLNLYIVEMKGVYKFSPDGEILWSQKPEPYEHASFPDGPSIMGGSIFVSTTLGELCAFDLEDGHLLWRNKYFPSTGGDSKYVSSHDGVVIIGTDSSDLMASGSKHVVAVNATNGEKLWDFAPDTPTWNNMAMFGDDGTFVLQDWDAKVYRLGLHNGTLLWKAGGMSKNPVGAPLYSETWTDGGTILGADGVVYAVSSKGHQMNSSAIPFSGGGIHAYRFDDGKLLWERDLPHPVLTWPVSGKLGNDSGYTVFAFPAAATFGPTDNMLVIFILVHCAITCCCFKLCCRCCCTSRKHWFRPAVAAACLAVLLPTLKYRFAHGTPAEVYALDAETGEVKWSYELDFMKEKLARGDGEGLWSRLVTHPTPWRPACVPVAYSSPSIDGNGVVLIGHESGKLFGVKDWNGDGKISKDEVSVFDAEAAFLHSGPALAPGLFAVTTCDSLWVWRL